MHELLKVEIPDICICIDSRLREIMRRLGENELRASVFFIPEIAASRRKRKR
jgi:hypothetical protein